MIRLICPEAFGLRLICLNHLFDCNPTPVDEKSIQQASTVFLEEQEAVKFLLQLTEKDFSSKILALKARG